MRIALIAPSGTSTRPGSPADSRTGITMLARALGELGHEVTLYARKDDRSLARRVRLAPTVVAEHVPAGPQARLAVDDIKPHIRTFSDHLAQRWRKDAPDVVHAHHWMSGLAALAAARDRAVPVVQTFGNAGGEAHGTGLRLTGQAGWAQALPGLRLKASLARQAGGVIVRSSQERQEVTGLGVPSAAVSVVPWGVDTRQFRPDGPAERRNGRPLLLTVSSLTRPRGPGSVIRALAEIPGVELLVAGGPARDELDGHQGYRFLAKLAAELGVADRVSFTGAVTANHLPGLLRSADLMVGTVWEEPFGSLPLQAMACGTPVIGPPGGICEDAVIDGTTGVLVPAGQPSVLARHIRSLLASPMRLDAYSVAAADRARARYSWDRIGRETVQAYERCLQAAA